jgi:tRNA nucleotidyltransferase (CCA-adding enzyme)
MLDTSAALSLNSVEMINIFKKHSDWPDVKEICAILKGRGFVAWLAGGCVRDALLGKVCNDFDIATDAQPEEVEKIFDKTVAVGKSFGVIRVICSSGADIEVTRFRRDGNYTDGRHPENIAPGTPQEDAERRDFTINGLFYDLETKRVFDFVGGKKDLNKKIIRAVGNPELRFSEDSLRILRAIRFSSQLGFDIEAKTFRAITKCAKSINQLSGERLQEELDKLFKGSHLKKSMNYFFKASLSKVLFPDLIKQPTVDSFSKFIKKENRVELCWLIFYSRIPESKHQIYFEKFKMSHKRKAQITEVLNLTEKLKIFSELSLSEQKKLAAHQYLSMALDFSIGLKLSQKNKSFLKLNSLMPEPFIKSADILGLNVVPGKIVGALLSESYKLQLDEFYQSRDEALIWLRKKIQKNC